jgi:hypothetical protein
MISQIVGLILGVVIGKEIATWIIKLIAEMAIVLLILI